MIVFPTDIESRGVGGKEGFYRMGSRLGLATAKFAHRKIWLGESCDEAEESSLAARHSDAEKGRDDRQTPDNSGCRGVQGI
jgi:hypothetical protein